MTRAFLLAAALLGLACCGPKPPPVVVPPGEVGCDPACVHVEALACGTSRALCRRLCLGVAPNNPQYPTCLAVAGSCAELDACGN